MDISKLMWATAKAFIIALVLTPIVRDVFRAYNVVDRPGRRKVHAYPIPRVGGVPIAIAFAFALFTLSNPAVPIPRDAIGMLAPGATIIFLTGLIDDFFNLSPVVKLLGEIAAAGVAYASGLSIDTYASIPLPVWISLPLTIFWLLLTTNALNLIDGLDGLCGGMGFFAAITFFAVGVLIDHRALAYVALPLAGALLGFLFHNFNPATVFLGDSGALSIGFVLGCFGVLWTKENTTFSSTIVPLLALAIPLMDVSLSVVRRWLRNRPIFSADRGHLHHRLLDRGYSVRRSALTLYAIALTGTAFAILLGYPAAREFHGAVVVGFVVACRAGIRQLRYAEFIMAGSLLFRGGFRRVLADKLRLQQLAEALEKAGNEQQWWNLLVEAAPEAGWTELKWTGDHSEHRAKLSEERPEWTFLIDLGDSEQIEIRGRRTDNGLDLTALSEALRRTFSGQRRAHAALP